MDAFWGSTGSDYADKLERLLQHTETMTESHIATIEMTLDVIYALEAMSLYAEPLRQIILKKRELCEKALREVQMAQAMNKKGR